MSREDSNNYREIFLSEAPLIDLRAPGEFKLGAFPTSANLPLMSDTEREKIGTCYKKKGQGAAIKLGHDLVKGQSKKDKILQWQSFANTHQDDGYFYCFRGGLRSKTSQQWLSDYGINLPIIKGGYKAMRRFLIDESERLVNQTDMVIVSGLTGCAKTKILKTQKNSIDLEALANHRGSSFGKNITPQPSQINFENNLAIELLKFEDSKFSTLLLEDECRLIGSRSLPLNLKNKMDQSNIVMIEESFDYRVSQIYSDYVIKMLEDIQNSITNKDQKVISVYENYLKSSTLGIKKRLGGAGLKEIMLLINKAITHQEKHDDLSLHRDWIVYLLKNYYDPMYLFQVGKKTNRVSFKGNTSAVLDYLNTIN